MAKKTSRSEAHDITAPGTPEKRAAKGRGRREMASGAVTGETGAGKLNSVADGPETVSRRLDAAADENQQRSGGAVAANDDRQTERRDLSEQDIRDRAYQMYLERGASDGQDFDDWLRAEDELKQRR